MSRGAGLDDFEYFGRRSAMVYHLVYHYSMWLHVNHILFLHTCVFGIVLMAASFGWYGVGVITGLYVGYTLWINAGLIGVLHTIVMAGIGFVHRKYGRDFGAMGLTRCARRVQQVFSAQHCGGAPRAELE